MISLSPPILELSVAVLSIKRDPLDIPRVAIGPRQNGYGVTRSRKCLSIDLETLQWKHVIVADVALLGVVGPLCKRSPGK